MMAANSATWTADTLADVIGFPLAGLFIGFLGTQASQLGLAFVRRFRDLRPLCRAARHDRRRAARPRELPRAQNALRNFTNQLVEGWQFLRNADR